MRVGKISAMLMLAVVVLWAAVPAFACLMPAQQDDCCRQMMQATGSCDMDASQSCCQVHGSDSNVPIGRAAPAERPVTLRSEEHTSELQSPDHLVCRLLLEKQQHR